VESVLDDRDVDVEGVALLEHAVPGNAVADLVVDRGADRLGEGLVARRRVVQRGWHGALDADHVSVAEVVQLAGGHARLHVRGDVVEHLGGKPARHAHLGNLFLILGYDRHPIPGKSADYARISGWFARLRVKFPASVLGCP